MKIKYGLTKRNIIDAMDKMERQKDFLYSHYIEDGNGKQIPLHLFARNTYINSERYIAELQNRVWSLVRFAEDRDLQNVFITLTLPSQYHRKKVLRNGKQIRNPKFAYQDVKIYDIITKKRPEKMYIHEIKVHKSNRLNYWTGKSTIQSLWKRSAMKKYDRLKYVRTFDDLLVFHDEYNEDVDEFLSKNLRFDVSLYDIETHKRVFYYSKLTLRQKPIADMPRWTGNFEVITLDPMDYMPLAGTKKLTDMWASIRKDRAWKDLQKDDRIYFRVTEPHKDGTPHLHISAWVPKQSVARLAQAVHRLFPAPLADVSVTYIPDGYHHVDKAYKRNGKWHDGYKIDPESPHYIKIHISDAVGYLMKYIYKTLDDLRGGDKGISEITIWYLHHGICRFYTSRTLVSLDVYRPLNGIFGGLDQLTYMYRNNTVTAWVDPESGTKQPQIIEYTSDIGEVFIMWKKRDYELKQYGKDDRKTTSQRTMIRTVDVEIDGEEYYMYRSDDACRLYHKDTAKNSMDEKETMVSVTAMGMYELWNYYHSLDPDDPSLNMHHYGHVHNTMINRGLIDGEIVPIDYYNTDFPYFEDEKEYA